MSIPSASGGGALKQRVDALLDEARLGSPRTIDDDQVAAVIERTPRSTPADATHWSIHSRRQRQTAGDAAESQRQMSDYKGAALMIDALPGPKPYDDRGYDADWFREPSHSAGSPPASPQRSTERCRSRTTPHSIARFGSRTCSAGSRIGRASTLAMTAVCAPSCLPSASPPPSSSGLINES